MVLHGYFHILISEGHRHFTVTLKQSNDFFHDLKANIYMTQFFEIYDKIKL